LEFVKPYRRYVTQNNKKWEESTKDDML
jgi:hypothetical protein